MADFKLDAAQIERLTASIKDAGDRAEDIINETFESVGVPEVEFAIIDLLPASGRAWKGKKAAASKTNPFEHKMGNLEFTVKTKRAYQYLYFPNDGTNTRSHAGNQQFMVRGAEAASATIVDRCLARLAGRLF